jgi:endonuclease/exonuclease/phosphatase family metal-dependent hydrolase
MGIVSAWLVCGFGGYVSAEMPASITVATWNVEWFFDAYRGDNFSDLAKQQSAPNDDEWDWRLDKIAEVVSKMKPTILALQEVESRYVVVRLTSRLKDAYGLNYRIAFIEGWDNFTGQDVAIIYQDGLVEYSCREQSKEMFQSQDYFNLQKHLFARFEWGQGDVRETLYLLTTHLRARPEQHDIRKRQARLMRYWVGNQVAAGANVIVLGDLNSEEKAGAVQPDSDIGILMGNTSDGAPGVLVDLHSRLPENQRATHLSGGQYDRILVSNALIVDEPEKVDLVYSRISNYRDLVVAGEPDGEIHFDDYYSIPRNERDLSDHYPVMAEFLFK